MKSLHKQYSFEKLHNKQFTVFEQNLPHKTTPTEPVRLDTSYSQIDTVPDQLLSHEDLLRMYKELKYSYNALEMEFHRYGQEAFQKINQLQQQMDSILAQKQAKIEKLTRQNLRLIEQSQIGTSQYHQGIGNSLHSQIELKLNKEKMSNYQHQIAHKKEIINHLTIQLTDQQQKLTSVIRKKDGEISSLIKEVQELNLSVRQNIDHEEKIKEKNRTLKQQIEELKNIFEELASQQLQGWNKRRSAVKNNRKSQLQAIRSYCSDSFYPTPQSFPKRFCYMDDQNLCREPAKNITNILNQQKWGYETIDNKQKSVFIKESIINRCKRLLLQP